MTKMTKQKKPEKTVFQKGDSQNNDKYLGDTYLNYEDLYEEFPDKIRYIMFGGLQSKNYIFLNRSRYGDFAKLTGSLIAQYMLQEQMIEMQKDPVKMAALKKSMDEMNNPNNTNVQVSHDAYQ